MGIPNSDVDSDSARRAWRRAAVTFRLTRQRSEDLLALSGEKSGASPTAALDLAIALAMQERRREAQDKPDSISALQGAAADALTTESGARVSLAAELREESARMRGMLADIAAQLRELQDAIVVAASQADAELHDSGGGVSDTEPEPLRAWLQREALMLRRPAFLVKALWSGSRRLANSGVRVELSVQRLASAELPGPAGRGASVVVHLSKAGSGEQSFQWDQPDAFYLMCQREPDGRWRIGLRLAASDRTLAPVSAVFKV